MCHVLVIEDEWLIAEHIGSIAEQAGASSIDYATTEAGAVESARRSPPAIILSDVRLAEGTGPDAVDTILKELGPIPTIFITGNPEACRPCDHAAAILRKPVMDEELISAFRRLTPRQT